VPSVQKVTEVPKIGTTWAIITVSGEHGENWTAIGTSVALARNTHLTRAYILRVSAFNKTSNVNYFRVVV